jgi:hypothetical protein
MRRNVALDEIANNFGDCRFVNCLCFQEVFLNNKASRKLVATGGKKMLA